MSNTQVYRKTTLITNFEPTIILPTPKKREPNRPCSPHARPTGWWNSW